MGTCNRIMVKGVWSQEWLLSSNDVNIGLAYNVSLLTRIGGSVDTRVYRPLKRRRHICGEIYGILVNVCSELYGLKHKSHERSYGKRASLQMTPPAGLQPLTLWLFTIIHRQFEWVTLFIFNSNYISAEKVNISFHNTLVTELKLKSRVKRVQCHKQFRCIKLSN